MTVAEFVEHWLESVAPSLRDSTASSYRQVCRTWILPHLGRVRLASLTPGHLNQLYAALAKDGGRKGKPLSVRSVRYTHTIIGKALGDAVAWGLLARNPASSAKPPRAVRTDMAVWDVTQVKTFLAAVTGDRLYALWLLLITTGLRRGEAAGLRWEDIDLDARRLAVRRALISVEYKVRVSEPKTARGRRTVALDDLTVDALRAHQDRQTKDIEAGGELVERTGYVFVREDGHPYHPERISQMFVELTKKAELPPIRLHDLRHTAATMALAAGVHPKVVQERLGHANINITLDTYSHVVEGMQDEAAAKVAGLLV
jgi:integrase